MMRKRTKHKAIPFAVGDLSGELMAARVKLAKSKALPPRFILEQYRAAIILLREMGASYAEIQMVLARHHIQVSASTVRNKLLGWQQQQNEDGTNTPIRTTGQTEVFTLKAGEAGA